MAKILGFDKLRKQLKDLKQAVGRSALRSATRAGAALIRDEARARAPRSTGKGAKGIQIEEKRSPSPDGAIMAVGYRRVPKEKTAFYLQFQDTGAKPHKISVFKTRGRRTKVTYRTKRVLVTSEGNFLGTTVRHPGITKRPILKPALEATRAAVVKAVGDKFKERINQVVAGITTASGDS